MKSMNHIGARYGDSKNNNWGGKKKERKKRVETLCGNCIT